MGQEESKHGEGIQEEGMAPGQTATGHAAAGHSRNGDRNTGHQSKRNGAGIKSKLSTGKGKDAIKKKDVPEHDLEGSAGVDKCTKGHQDIHTKMVSDSFSNKLESGRAMPTEKSATNSLQDRKSAVGSQHGETPSGQHPQILTLTTSSSTETTSGDLPPSANMNKMTSSENIQQGHPQCQSVVAEYDMQHYFPSMQTKFATGKIMENVADKPQLNILPSKPKLPGTVTSPSQRSLATNSSICNQSISQSNHTDVSSGGTTKNVASPATKDLRNFNIPYPFVDQTTCEVKSDTARRLEDHSLRVSQLLDKSSLAPITASDNEAQYDNILSESDKQQEHTEGEVSEHKDEKQEEDITHTTCTGHLTPDRDAAHTQYSPAINLGSDVPRPHTYETIEYESEYQTKTHYKQDNLQELPHSLTLDSSSDLDTPDSTDVHSSPEEGVSELQHGEDEPKECNSIQLQDLSNDSKVRSLLL